MRPATRTLILAGLVLAPFARKAGAQETEIVSLLPGGGEHVLNDITQMDLSGDGTLVAFAVVPPLGDSSVYVRDLAGDVTTLAFSSQLSLGNPALDLDGDTLAFDTKDSGVLGGFFGQNVVVLDTSGFEVISVNLAGVPAAGLRARLSDDGSRVVFESNAQGVTSEPTAFGVTNIYARDRNTQTTQLCSISLSGTGAGALCWDADVSGDGNHVVFVSGSANLVPGDANNSSDVFVRDLTTSQTALISKNSLGVQADSHSRSPSISFDGRYVAFISSGSNMGTPFLEGVYIHDRDFDEDGVFDETHPGAIETALISLDYLSNPANGVWANPQISADGGWVALGGSTFDPTYSPNWDGMEVFIYSVADDEVWNVHVDSDGKHPVGFSAQPDSYYGLSISAGGGVVAYVSRASDLAAPDTDLFGDVFAHHVCENPAKQLGSWHQSWATGLKPEFSICGDILGPVPAEARLRSALPGATNYIALGFFPSPTMPFGPSGGTIIPGAPFIIGLPANPLPLVDAEGCVTIPVSAGGPGGTVYVQWAVVDPTTPGGFSLSNALEVDLTP